MTQFLAGSSRSTVGNRRQSLRRRPSIGGAAEPGDALTNWAYVPFTTIGYQTSVTDILSGLALSERWFFGDAADPSNPHPVLTSYLKYTFYRLQREKKVLERGGNATFNTGLVDRLYDPIFALFKLNPRAEEGFQQWSFLDFCVPGKGSSGKKLTEIFDPLPEPPSYFRSMYDMFLDTSKQIHVDYDHVIFDGIERGRFPAEFLRKHLPSGLAWQDFKTNPIEEREAFLQEFVQALKADDQCLRGIKWRLDDARRLAEKRSRWNFKTAIPQYYPRHDNMSLLLPLSLIDDRVVDIALVVTRNQSGSYQGRTVLPLAWAYREPRVDGLGE